jgi:L-lactate utilization protein LutC
MEASSATLNEIGVIKDLEESGEYRSLKKEITSINDAQKRNEFRRKSAIPEYEIGSVHAVTEYGEVLIASATGSQLAPYVFGAANVIWVVGTQKIVKNLDDAFRRLREYTFPLEDARMKKTYGAGSGINKILIFDKEVVPNRVKLIFVKEKLGF